MKTKVGVICGAATGRVYAVINPDDDSELDNPRWLLIQIATELREPISLVQVPLYEYTVCTNQEQVQAAAHRHLVLEDNDPEPNHKRKRRGK